MGATVDRRLDHTATLMRAGTSSEYPQRRPPPWLRRRHAVLLVTDGAAATVAVILARYWAFSADSATLHLGGVGLPYILAALLAVPAWLLALAVSHAYDLGPFGHIDQEGRRVVSAGAHFLAVTAVAYYGINMERVAREFLIAIIPLAVALTLIGRAAAALRLHRARNRGEADRRAVFLGPPNTTRPVVEHLRRFPRSGIRFAVRSEDPPRRAHQSTPDRAGHAGTSANRSLNRAGKDRGSEARATGDDVPRAETPDEALELLHQTDADLILVTTTLAPGELRTLTWALEGSGVTLLVAPPSTPMAGPDLNVRPVAGLPLLYVENRRSTPAAV